MANCWAGKLFKGDTASVQIPGTDQWLTLLVAQSKVTYIGSGIGELRIEYGGSLDDSKIPDPEQSFDRQQMELAVEKNLKWHELFEGQLGGLMCQTLEALLRCKTRTEMEAVDYADFFIKDIPTPEGDGKNTNFDEDCGKVFTLRAKGIHTYAIYPPTISVVDYWLQAPPLDAGGYIDIPDVRAYSLPLGVEWLRCGDKSKWNGTYYERTRTWIGAPEWDKDLYPNPLEPDPVPAQPG